MSKEAIYTVEDLRKAFMAGMEMLYRNSKDERKGVKSTLCWDEYWNTIKPLEEGYYWVYISENDFNRDDKDVCKYLGGHWWITGNEVERESIYKVIEYIPEPTQGKP